MTNSTTNAASEEDNPRDRGCLCQRCNYRYKVDFMLPDSLWAKIHGGYNLLCGMCITQLIEGLDQFDYFDVLKLEETAHVN